MKLASFNKGTITSSLKMLAAIPIGLAMRLWKKDIWLITERPGQARDNGYCFFKYLRKEHPQQQAYYIMDKSSEDYKKIKAYGNCISFDSFRHYVYYCLSRVHISSHVGGCCPTGGVICKRIKKLLGVRDVFLPHGVSYGISEFCLKKYAKIDLFICSTEPEYRNVLENYGYSSDEVAYTGFPRLDQWHTLQKNPKQIVLMPTWRLYLAQDPNTVFPETAYYRAYQSLLDDPSLHTFLEQNGLTLVFYLHHEMRKFAGHFKTDCKNIVIADRDVQYDIQQLLRSSALLITDYSSVHFDFAYMNKPVIYYPFDREEFFSRQYEKSSFDADRDGFGPVVTDIPALVRALNQSFQKDFEMQPDYYNRMRKFYKLYDDQNCHRVYAALQRSCNKWFS